MYCIECSTENAEGRKYCGECGHLIVNFCQRCRFINSLADKFCGGCGINLSNVTISVSKEKIFSQPSDKTPAKYSAEDINELIDEHVRKKDKKLTKGKETDEASQDLIDVIFNPDESETKEKED